MSVSTTTENTSILVVDDEEGIRHFLQLLLRREGFTVEAAENADDAFERLQSDAFDIAICDVRMPGQLDGLGLLGAMRESSVACDVVMMSAYGSRETALEAVRRGAYDYIDKPIQADDLLLTLHKLLERKRLHHENRQLRAALRGAHEDCGIISRSAAFQDILTKARKAAIYPTGMLLLGETGTGKSLLAKAIHTWGNRSEKPFKDVNIGAIPSNLLESELFGYARGAFTGANRDYQGLILSADGGVLFLDEIGEMPLELQVKLLRVLEDNKVRRLGETSPRSVDFKVIAATNKNLAEEVAAGRFRQDLYYRLRLIDLWIPPLRERPEDIPHLVDEFIARFNVSYRMNIQGVSPEAMRALMAHQWHGNVRELKNVIESSIIYETNDKLSFDSLPLEIREGDNTASPLDPALAPDDIYIPPHMLSVKEVSREVEILLIKRALAQTDGNKSAAARLLDLSHRALLYKVKEYALN